MELTLQYFWAIKLAFVLFVIWVCYKAFWVNQFDSAKWNLFALALLLLAYIQPIKLDSASTTNTQQIRTNQLVQQSKVLPEKLVDNSFSKVLDDKGIKPEDLK